MRSRERQFLGVLAGPDQAVDAALHRALDADVEHVLVDVGHGDSAPGGGQAEGDVAGAARHVEDRLALARLDRRTKRSFHSRCMPPDIASFITSYLRATLEKTAPYALGLFLGG
jgi:hypothetical protein